MKILIADDQPHLCELLAEQVRPWGYQAQVVNDGLAALEALQEPEAPRLALLDWLMPGLDGIEVCRRVRLAPSEHYPYLVLLTGQGGRDQMLEGLDAGADDFLSKPVDEAELKARLGAGRRIVALQEQLLATQRKLHERATRDALTGLWNRGSILEILDRERARADRENRHVGVVLGDIDHFKRINDTHGHLTGDEVLRQAARRMQGVLRPYDMVGRYGGEEFLVVLPGCTADTCADLAERLRQSVAAEPVAWEAHQVRVTLSLGVSVWTGTGDAIGLLRAADEALYRAKQAGRNRVSLSWSADPAAHPFA